MKLVRVLCLVVFALFALNAFSNPPSELDYQGKVLVSDVPYNGDGYFKFAIGNVGGTTNFWSNDGTTAGEPAGCITNSVFNGIFSTVLGSAPMTALDPDIFSNGNDLYLRVWFGTTSATFNEMLPAQKLESSAYAINADQVDGMDAAEIVAAATNGVSLSGDISGSPAEGTTVNSLQGTALDIEVPSEGEVLTWNGTAWSNVVGGIGGAAASNAFVLKAGDTMTGTLTINAPGGLKIDSASNEVEIGNSANGASGGTAVGRMADGFASGAAVGNRANGNWYGVALGDTAWGTNAGVAVGWQAIASDNGAAVGYSAIGFLSGAALGRSANGVNGGAAVGFFADGSVNGSAVGSSARGTNDGAALGRLANGSSEGVAAGVGADGSSAGVAIGRSSRGFLNGVAVGYEARGTNSGAAVGIRANGSDSGAALGDSADGRSSGVGVGYRAAGAGNGVAVGNQSKGGNFGVGVGTSAVGTNYGAALGYAADGNSHGTAVGEQSSGFDFGVAAGYQAYGNNAGVGIGQNADGSGTNVAVGVGASAGAGSERIAIGHNVFNSVDESTRIRGTFYMDGGTAVVARSTFGGGLWTTLLPLPPLDNVIWVATNGTPAGPGTIDRPYDTPQNGYNAAALRYAGQPATLVISGGKYGGILTMNAGNIHLFGVSRPELGTLNVASFKSGISGKQRVENIVFGGLVQVNLDSGDIKFHNCRMENGLAILGHDVEVQDCFLKGGDAPALDVAPGSGIISVYNSSMEVNSITFPALRVGMSVVQFEMIGNEIVNKGGGIAINDLETPGPSSPMHLYSHNYIKGPMTMYPLPGFPAIACPLNTTNTLALHQNTIWGDVGVSQSDQYHANNTIYGAMIWGQGGAGGLGMDAYGNMQFTIPRSLPDSWND